MVSQKDGTAKVTLGPQIHKEQPLLGELGAHPESRNAAAQHMQAGEESAIDVGSAKRANAYSIGGGDHTSAPYDDLMRTELV